ncbi:MAG: helix-turn-helix domain-containing protein [Magnetospiraceae bacterium]
MKFLPVKTVADELCVCTKTVYSMIAAGDLPAVRLPGHTIRVSRTDLDQYLAECRDRQEQRLNTGSVESKGGGLGMSSGPRSTSAARSAKVRGALKGRMRKNG